MKKKLSAKKLVLDKMTISSLNEYSISQIEGGYDDITSIVKTKERPECIDTSFACNLPE